MEFSLHEMDNMLKNYFLFFWEEYIWKLHRLYRHGWVLHLRENLSLMNFWAIWKYLTIWIIVIFCLFFKWENNKIKKMHHRFNLWCNKMAGKSSRRCPSPYVLDDLHLSRLYYIQNNWIIQVNVKYNFLSFSNFSCIPNSIWIFSSFIFYFRIVYIFSSV